MLVMKFGGTSVGGTQAMLQAAKIVAGRVNQSPIVVVSAMATVTNELIKVAQAALKNRMNEVGDLLTGLNRMHMRVACDLIAAARGQAGGIYGCNKCFNFGDIGKTLQAVRDVAEAVCVSRELTPRNRAIIIGAGEILSCAIFPLALLAQGVKARQTDARQFIITDNSFPDVSPLMPHISQFAPQHLDPIVEKGMVPVVPGFIALTIEGVPVTFTRGGSDFTAMILGAALKSSVEIWTDVNGFMTADPKLVSSARRIPALSFSEAAELAIFGAQVLHTRAALLAVASRIPFRIMNTNNPECEGTIIQADAPRNGLVKSIACKEGAITISVTSTDMVLASGFLEEITTIFKKYGVVVDVVTTSEVTVSVTIDDLSKVALVKPELELLGEVAVGYDKAIVCLVEDNLNIIRVGARIFPMLESVMPNLDVQMMSQGASRRNWTFVIDQKELKVVVPKLHDSLFSGQDSET